MEGPRKVFVLHCCPRKLPPKLMPDAARHLQMRMGTPTPHHTMGKHQLQNVPGCALRTHTVPTVCAMYRLRAPTVERREALVCEVSVCGLGCQSFETDTLHCGRCQENLVPH